VLAPCFMLVLAWLTVQPWRCGQHIPAKNRLTLDGLHGVISLRLEIWLLRERRLQEMTAFSLSIIFNWDIWKFKFKKPSRRRNECRWCKLLNPFSLRTEEPCKDKQKQTNSPAVRMLGRRLAPHLIDFWCKSAPVNEEVRHNLQQTVETTEYRG
jgi:hypothetical protein